MNDTSTARQKIVEKIKESSNILVTLGQNPSVDELSAALGLTVLLNKLNKHATAVVSGAIPPAIEFLEPGKTFENTVDSLRDFIIALDKEKADHLRYKVEGDVVKIFITPYKTTISQDDLDFSQGDYNVELVLALGVKDEAHLDTALEAHGKILHDATVATVTSGEDTSDLGSIAWHDASASSVSEMLVALSEALKGDKPLLDEQTATAFLTGIVASTDRFSNNKTSSKVMTMAAQLMAAGANQQLIAAKLSEAHEISTPDATKSDGGNSDGTTDLSEDTSTKVDKTDKTKKDTADSKKEAPSDKSQLNIAHEPKGTLEEVGEEVAQKNTDEAAEKAEDALAKQLDAVAPAATDANKPSIDDLRKDIASASGDVNEAAEQSDLTNVAPQTDPSMPAYEPTMGGTLNATTEQAAIDKRAEEARQQNHTLLSHGEGPASNAPEELQSNGPVFDTPPFSAASTPAPFSSPVSDDTSTSSTALPPAELPSVQAAPIAPSTQADDASSVPSLTNAPLPPMQTLADIDSANRAPHEDALANVHAAFSDAPVAQPQPTDQQPDVSVPDATALPPLPDLSALPPPPPAPPIAPFAPSGDQNLGQIFPSPEQGTQAPESNDPAQFKIPGQN